MDGCDCISEQEPKDEIFWEPRRKEKGLRVEEQKFGDYECYEIILSVEEENCISQPWKKGVIVKILVKISTLTWSANFCPAGDMIEELVVWVRISSLSIEYYDNRVLSYIADYIGKTIKVDKNTLSREIGKYVPQSDVKENKGSEGEPRGVHNEEDGDKTIGPWVAVQKSRRMRKQKFDIGKEVNESVEAGIILKNKGNTSGVVSRF
ncbi:hypothetical protein KIW84_025193 [Lathyrus oleraceus]|uniref:DUF4283 domain-containing protein n=1 Tax=Pisum sativum TaxID=3888 RepID=A0A9D4YHN7_PEA|nr:hypothetical protein KIW84_025193 [Pisum sativum]